MKLQTVDLVLVVIYLIGIAALGLWVGRGVKSGKDRFLGGRSLPTQHAIVQSVIMKGPEPTLRALMETAAGRTRWSLTRRESFTVIQTATITSPTTPRVA